MNTHRSETEYDHYYELVTDISYINIFIPEVLPIFPITIQPTSRECNRRRSATISQWTKSIQVHDFSLGSVKQSHILTSHFSQEDHYQFIPQRHFTPRHPISWMALANGSTNCIEMRRVIIELKIGLTRLFSRNNISLGHKLEQNFHSFVRVLL